MAEEERQFPQASIRSSSTGTCSRSGVSTLPHGNTATAMYHSGKNPLRKVTAESEAVVIPKGLKQRRLHKAFLRYHDAENWPLLRDALKQMGRADLIGNGKKHLVPSYQPRGTGGSGEGTRAGSGRGNGRFKTFRTQHVRSKRRKD